MSINNVLIFYPEDWKCEQNIDKLRDFCAKQGKSVAVARLKNKTGLISQACNAARAFGLPSDFWLLDARYTLDNFPSVPDYSTVWYTDKTFAGSLYRNHGGLYFIKDGSLKDLKFFDDVVARASPDAHPYQAFVLAHDEPDGVVETAWKNSLSSFGSIIAWRSEKNIYHSHKALADKSSTSMFFVVDADFQFVTPFVAQEQTGNDELYVHVWNALNPINGLVYGHGGLKLFPSYVFDSGIQVGLDTTMGVCRHGIKVHPECYGVHAFNWSPFSTWRTAVREAFKLQKALIFPNDPSFDKEQTEYRLSVWTTVANPEQPFADLCTAGANYGKNAALTNHTVNNGWINDYRLLRQRFDSQFVSN